MGCRWLVTGSARCGDHAIGLVPRVLPTGRVPGLCRRNWCPTLGLTSGDDAGGKGRELPPFPQSAPFFWRGVGSLFFRERKGSPPSFAAHTKPARCRGRRIGRHGQLPLSSPGYARRPWSALHPSAGDLRHCVVITRPVSALLRLYPAADQRGSGTWDPAASTPHCSPAPPGRGRSRGGPGAAE